MTVAPGGKVALGFSEVAERIAALALPSVDAVVGVAQRGTMSAALVAYRLGREGRS